MTFELRSDGGKGASQINSCKKNIQANGTKNSERALSVGKY